MSYNSRIFLTKSVTYYSQNYSGIIGSSLRDVPFHQPQQLKRSHHGATFVSLCTLILFSQPRKVRICSRHIIASVWDIMIAGVLLTLFIFLAYYVMKWVRHCWNWGVMTFRYQDMGHTFYEHIFHIFYYGWMDCNNAFHGVLYLYCCVTDRK